jgi:hypothetical protein
MVAAGMEESGDMVSLPAKMAARRGRSAVARHA